MEVLRTDNRPLVEQSTHGEVALQALEVLLLHLIEKRVVDAATLVAEIDSLAIASLDGGEEPRAVTVGGRLAALAQSIALHNTHNG